MNDASIINIESPNYEVCQERCNVLASKQVITCDNTCKCNCPKKVRPCISSPNHVSSSSTHSSSGYSSGSDCSSGSGCSSATGSGSGSGSGSGMLFINEKIKSSSSCQYNHCPCSKEVVKITFK